MDIAYLFAEPIMSSTIAALPPPTHQIPYQPEYDGAPDVPEIAFSELWQDKKEGMSFGDFLDIINPLQHIPIVSTIYRMVTEDDIGVGSRVLGGALFGGPIGLIGAGLTAIFEEISGGTVEEHVASLWNTLTDDGDATAQIATAEKTGPAPAAVPVIKNDYAAAATQSGKAVVETKPIAIPTLIAATAKITPSQPTAPTQLSPRPLARPPVTVAPMSAVHRVTSRQPQIQTADRNAESQRIAKAIDQAQRAQAGLLLANLGADQSDQPREANERTAPQQVQPFKSHPYLLPRGAPPELISRAMEQALAKYQANLQQRSGAITAASPRSMPAPVR